MHVSVETYRGSPISSRCCNFPGFFHPSKDCRLSKKCIKYSAVHSSVECDQPLEKPLTCSVCGLNHVANLRGCPRLPGARKKKVPHLKRIQTGYNDCLAEWSLTPYPMQK
ncbi:hypothetical protein CDAR_95841 [Caerostris darwini]|uniref:Uncharacterized protein n=1 Tax=Caerostris darwini TaxID=1538125 RepID=A0AAV4UPL8_9ARAC|nr:hypothetical protein CDAR_95841 [Caerostris darwini]